MRTDFLSDFQPINRMKGYDLVDPRELKANPENPNIHSEEQLVELSKIIEHQGWRRGITVSLRSGFVTVGHGRRAAALSRGWLVPVSFQEYDSIEQEYADMVADNAIDDWARLDLGKINSRLPALGPDFDLSLLGIKDFKLDPSENEVKHVEFDATSNDNAQWIVAVTLSSESEMQSLFEELQRRGLECKLIT